MKTFKIEIDRHLDPNHFVEQNYPGQLPEQMQIYLLIDLDTRIPTVYVETYNKRYADRYLAQPQDML